jgi:hypothetical protein
MKVRAVRAIGWEFTHDDGRVVRASVFGEDAILYFETDTTMGGVRWVRGADLLDLMAHAAQMLEGA